MPLEIVPFDATEFLDTEESQTHLIEDAFESGDAGYIAHALGVVAKARGMSQVARNAGVTREALYKSLSEKGDPKLSTLIGVAAALGYKLTATPVDASAREDERRSA
ncbi:addiction module antidote protein [Rhizobium esperanzae]|uniref:Putative addiction module antidote protein n=1 Tax=Rhizobium esperanzae TaxID=1967781 RepID=A0A7W6R8W7_9HYPH|nr:addiction module antidote protein [Rhizobium esperanzae]MBB4238998.1 putative addiction module antidote protein [Rhizobium esperanzae]